MSLATIPTHALAVCGSCAGNRITSITMTLTDGTAVDFTSCHSCETKSWKQAGRELDITTVLGKAQKHKR
jgi:predicted metal-binding protein